MKIRKIVITGGPCAGKTSAMEWIRRDIARAGYRVLVIPETATEFITGGVAPWTCGTNYDYQLVQMHLQREKERCYLQAAKTMEQQTDKILIVCDRAMFDNMIYMTKDEFYSILEYMDSSVEEMLQNYDAVFHLVTSAIGTSAYETDLGNAIRYESRDQAAMMDHKFLVAWGQHPQHYRIDSNEAFDSKMQKLINGILRFLEEEPAYPEAAFPEYLAPFTEKGDWVNQQEFPES